MEKSATVAANAISVSCMNLLSPLQKCDSGSCVTRAVLNAESPPNVFEVHGVGHVTPRFSLLSTCRCPANFGGVSCDRPRNVCATVACKSPRVCVPSPLQPGTHACVCAPPWAGNNCEVLNRPQGDPKACFSETCFTQRGLCIHILPSNGGCSAWLLLDKT